MLGVLEALNPLATQVALALALALTSGKLKFNYKFQFNTIEFAMKRSKIEWC